MNNSIDWNGSTGRLKLYEKHQLVVSLRESLVRYHKVILRMNYVFTLLSLSSLSHPFIPKPTIFAKPAVGLVVSDSLFTDEAAENYIITFQWRILDKHFFF